MSMCPAGQALAGLRGVRSQRRMLSNHTLSFQFIESCHFSPEKHSSSSTWGWGQRAG